MPISLILFLIIPPSLFYSYTYHQVIQYPTMLIFPHYTPFIPVSHSPCMPSLSNTQLTHSFPYHFSLSKLIHTHLIYPAVTTLISPPCITAKLKKWGSDIKYLATVLAIGTECGIALLTVNDDEFRDGVKPVKFEDSSTLKDAITVAELPNQVWCNPYHKWCCITHGGVALCSWFNRAS